MLGTIINTCTILFGSTLGTMLGYGMQEKYQRVLFNALGLATLMLGANAALPNMAKSEYPVMFILSLAIGGVIGTWLDLQGKIDSHTPSSESSPANTDRVTGLVTGCLLYCIGTFSIVGPLLSALSPSHGWQLNESANTFLYTNATLDFVSSIILSATYGRIMLWAAPILFCWQGTFYAIAYFFGGAMPEEMRTELSIVGGCLILSSGLAILGIKDCKTVNLLPSLLVPVVFYIVKALLF